MFLVNDDLSIYATRGDIVCLNVSATDDRTGEPYEFQPGDILQMKIYAKKDAESVVLQKDFPVPAKTNTVGVFLTEQDTKFGEVISKPTDYWYEVTLNPYTNPQTFIGYDEDGAKIFKLFPEGKDVESDEEEITPEDIPVVDADLSLLSSRPVENKAIARAIALVQNDMALMDSRLSGKIKENKKSGEAIAEELAVERARIDNLVASPTPGDSELVDIRVGADGVTYDSAGTAVREQFGRKIGNHALATFMPLVVKGAQTLTVSVGDLEIVNRNKYIDYSGNYQDLEGCNVYKFPFNEYMEEVRIVDGESYIRGLVFTEDGTFFKRLDEVTKGLLTRKDGYILINHDHNQSEKGIQTLTVKFMEKPYEGTKVGEGRIQADNTFETFSVDATCYLMELDPAKDYYYHGFDTALVVGMAYDYDMNPLGEITLDSNHKMVLPNKTVKIRLNRITGATLECTDKAYSFQTVVNKPFVFAGEEADCFGDSITAGYTTSEAITENGWVALIKDKLGLNKAYNKGRGGHCLTDVVSTTNNMLAVFRNENPASKYLFFAIGTNDYGQQADIGEWDSTDESTMYGALNALFANINERFPSREVIFILPINRADGNPAHPFHTLDEYRQAIYKKCIANGASVINGADFGFPTASGDELAEVLFGDGLHPSEAGYKLYAKCVCGALT